MSAAFRYYLRVRYGECDAQKVVFNVRYGEYVDLAVGEWFRALGYGAQMVSGELDFQLVKQTLEWKHPARYDDVLEIAVATQRLGNTSFVLGCEFRIAGDERVIANAETVYVLVDHATLGKRTLPEDLRARMQQGTSAQIDHAHYLRE
ncbi:MAG: acyl-CoA thioesterase [Stenotrophobium sp.]